MEPALRVSEVAHSRRQIGCSTAASGARAHRRPIPQGTPDSTGLGACPGMQTRPDPRTNIQPKLGPEFSDVLNQALHTSPPAYSFRGQCRCHPLGNQKWTLREDVVSDRSAREAPRAATYIPFPRPKQTSPAGVHGQQRRTVSARVPRQSDTEPSQTWKLTDY